MSDRAIVEEEVQPGMSDTRDASTLDTSWAVDLRGVLRRRWPVLAIALVVGGVLGAGVVSSLDPVHETSIEVLVGPVVPDADVLEGSTDLARTYGEIVETERVVTDAAEAAGVDPGAAQVSASAGRGSATLTITVQADSPDGVLAFGTAVVDRLTAIVAEARPPTPDPSELPVDDEGDVDTSALFPSGTQLVVLDDGSGNVVDRSLGVPIGAVAGAGASAMVVASLVLALEQRRRAGSSRAAVARAVGADLGELALTPAWTSLWRSGRLTVNTGRSGARFSRRVREIVITSPHDGPTVVFVTALSDNDDHIRCLLQLTSAMSEPPVIVDPNHVFADDMPVDYLMRGFIQQLRLGHREMARIVAPRRDQLVAARTPDGARRICETLGGSASAVLVFLPAGHRHVGWQGWAAAADHAVVLTVPRDVEVVEELQSLADRVRAVQPRLLGAVRARRPLVLGKVSRVRPTAAAQHEITPAPAGRA